MTRPIAGQILSRTRFFLLFLILALTTFEWQYFVTQRFGKESGGVTLGLSFSIGTLSMMLVLAGLSLCGRSLAISKIPSILLVGNALVSWLLVRYVDSWDWLERSVYVVTACHASLNLLTLSVEVSAVQLKEELRYSHVRIFGSLGYLAAAFISQQWGGFLFPAIGLLAIVFVALPMLSVRVSDVFSPSPHLSSARFRPLLWLAFTAFILWSVSRGFEALGPIYLRSAMDQGLIWLSVLIISESVILQWVDRCNPSWVIIGAALMWSGVYGLFAYGLTPATACCALFLAGFNCPAQVVLQTKVGKLFPGVPAAQALLSIAGAAGGFGSSLFYVWVARQWGESILGYCVIQSLLAAPLLWICFAMVNRDHPDPPPLELVTKEPQENKASHVTQAA